MKKNKDVSNFRRYYNGLISHRGLTIHDENATIIMNQLFAMAMVILGIIICLIVFKNSTFVKYITIGSPIYYKIYLLLLIYICIVITSYVIYQRISYRYESKEKHELLNSDIVGIHKFFYGLFLGIHFLWIIIGCATKKILIILRIKNLEDCFPLIIAGDFCFAVVEFFLVIYAHDLLYSFLDHHSALLFGPITKVTYLYIVICIIISLSALGYNKLISLFFAKKPKCVYKQSQLLNFYFLVMLTLALKAMHFEGDVKDLVDAFFYSSDALALIATARDRRH